MAGAQPRPQAWPAGGGCGGCLAVPEEKEARFLVEVEQAAGSFKVLQPEATELVVDRSLHYRDTAEHPLRQRPP